MFMASRASSFKFQQAYTLAGLYENSQSAMDFHIPKDSFITPFLMIRIRLIFRYMSIKVQSVEINKFYRGPNEFPGDLLKRLHVGLELL